MASTTSDDDTAAAKKQLILIRHGCSYMNEYIGANGITFGGPNFTDIFPPDDHEKYYRDSPLSPAGQQQAEDLRKSIMLGNPQQQRDNHDRQKVLEELELVVVSPLTRAIQTAQLALLPHIQRNRIPVKALPLASERLYLVSDIGRPRSELQQKYGHFANFDLLKAEEWWYQSTTTPDNNEWRPVGQGQSYSCPGEPYDVFHQRMMDLCQWLDQRPESTIALVGHYGVFEWLLHDQDNNKVKFGNCEMKVVAMAEILQRIAATRQ